MLNFNSILIGSENPKKLAEFYENVLAVKPEWQEGDWTGFQVGTGHIAIGPHDKVLGKSQHPERLIVNLETLNVQIEFDRIKGLGAQVVAAPYQPEQAKDMWIATFADTDGNYFQLMSPMPKSN